MTPREAFEDNLRPAQLLLTVYKLLETNAIQTSGELVDRLRELVDAKGNEDLMLIYNHIFMGLVRQNARIPASDLKTSALANLLRQSVVAACTSLETYLPALLRANLPAVIKARGRHFLPKDADVQTHFKGLTFSLPEVGRLLEDPEGAPLYIANKIVGMTDFAYLGGTKGMHVAGCLIGLPDTWPQIAAHLRRDRAEMRTVIDDTIKRRNDIVHRADRPQKDAAGEIQSISLAWSHQAVDTIMHVCLALDELVSEHISALRDPIPFPDSLVS
jgi:hypothetical protein